MSVNQDRLVSDFVSLVSIHSPTYGERSMADHLKTRLAELGLTVYEDNAGAQIGGSCGNLYGFLEGTAPGETLLFSCHMDTVEPCAGKRAVMAPDGKITSAGDTILGADNLSGVAAILEALRVIREERLPHPPIEVMFSVAEEVYCLGAAHLEPGRLKARQAFVLDMAGQAGLAALRAPTIVTFTVTLHGKASHAGFAPEKGIHAIDAAVRAIRALPMGRLDDETTLNVGTIQGGLATNIIPPQCVVQGEIRSYNHERAVDLAQTVRTQFEASAAEVGAGADFASRLCVQAYQTPEDHPSVLRFRQACQALELPCLLTETFGGSDNNVFALHGIPGLVLACAMFDCHSCGEYTLIPELVRVAELTVRLMTLL